MAFQAHNLQAHAQQLEVESVQANTHLNVGLQLEQVGLCSLPHQSVCLPCLQICLQLLQQGVTPMFRCSDKLHACVDGMLLL